MRFWLDTEYEDSGAQLELISLGAVAEDGREFYAISTEFDPSRVKPWVKENVLPHLAPRESSVWKPLHTIGTEFVAFVGEEPAEFWSLIATADWHMVVQVCLCVFRSKVTTHFGPKLPLISEQSYHLFRSESFHFLCRCRNGW